MSSIVIITSETAGRVAISCELARRLAARNHTATIACLADISERVAGFGRSFTRLGAGSGEEDVALLGAQLGDLHADLILVDIELPLPIMAATTTDARVALWTSLFSVWKRPGLPPLHTGIVPGHGWRGSRPGMEWAWLRYRLGRWLGRLQRRLRRRGPDRVARLRHAAELTGFPFDEEVMQHQWLVPFAYRHLPVIAFNTFELELPHEPHPTVRYVGPVLGEMPSLPDQEQTRQRLAGLYERRARGDSDALVYCAFGAWHKGDDSSFVRRVIDAARVEPSWDVVIGLGGRRDLEDLGNLPANVHALGWAPQGEVITHADVAIHHAGVTSVNECVAAAVPMVLYPFDFLDQRGNAARVVFHRLGVVGDRDRDTAARIHDRIRFVLEDETLARRIRRMSDYLERDRTDDKAVLAVLALLDTGDE